MQNHFNILAQTRKNFIKVTEGFSDEQLNIIPEGLNNNLIWNMAHVVVTQQLLCYGLSGLPFHVDNELIAAYRKGSKPEGTVSSDKIQMIKKLLSSTPDLLEADFAAGKFENFKDYPTSFGITLTSIEDAITFNNVHESMHLGTVLAIKNLV